MEFRLRVRSLNATQVQVMYQTNTNRGGWHTVLVKVYSRATMLSEMVTDEATLRSAGKWKTN